MLDSDLEARNDKRAFTDENQKPVGECTGTSNVRTQLAKDSSKQMICRAEMAKSDVFRRPPLDAATRELMLHFTRRADSFGVADCRSRPAAASLYSRFE